MQYKVGIGYDVHCLVRKKKLFLGGVDIPFKKGLLAHSDGDVLVHAVCDAILGAAGLGDIGIHFPDTDKKYKGISSIKLLCEVYKKIVRKNYKIENVDCVLILDKPKIGPYRNSMVGKLSETLKVPSSSVNIKATTSEGVGDIGSKAIASYAVVLLKKP